jgi:hypothetical protein
MSCFGGGSCYLNFGGGNCATLPVCGVIARTCTAVPVITSCGKTTTLCTASVTNGATGATGASSTASLSGGATSSISGGGGLSGLAGVVSALGSTASTLLAQANNPNLIPKGLQTTTSANMTSLLLIGGLVLVAFLVFDKK